ncbi:uncharacterized protein LOC113426728 [Notechis scutatus]|uniref:Uncharacterized protein LOC113426728 n=1 Tax=Notechis scutatus TaxID=8663 RepID=A0A6J1VPC2_9SAUR|nr:uncharacterized protein LOC113426728 [Notechis scutatus]
MHLGVGEKGHKYGLMQDCCSVSFVQYKDTSFPAGRGVGKAATDGQIYTKQVCQEVDFDIKGQGLLSILDSAPDLMLPPLDKYRHCQCVHAAVLNIFLSVVLRIQPQEFSCTPNVFSGADALRATILALIPEPPPFISSAILYFRVSLLQSPVLQLGNGFAIVQVSVQLEFFVKNLDGSTTSIVILQESLSLSATFTVTNGHLHASLSISE